MIKKPLICTIIYCALTCLPINAQVTDPNTLTESGKIDSEITSTKNIDTNNLNTKDNIILADLAMKEFKDLDQKSWAFQAVVELTQKYNVLVGMPDKTFHGDRPATRYELAQALAKLITKIDQDHLQLSPVEQAAIKSLQAEFEQEITTLSLRVEKNEYRITEAEETHKADIDKLTTSINTLNNRNYISPEIRARYGFGDAAPNDGTLTETRLRLTSGTKIYNNTFAIIRLQAYSPNLINVSEKFSEPVTTDLTLAYITTEDLTKWFPVKIGKLDLFGGVMPTSWLFFAKNYFVDVDQKGFNDANESFSPYNTTPIVFSREGPNGRRIALGGEYSKDFSKYNAKIKAGALRSTGGSIDLPGPDIFSSGRESTFFTAMGQLDLPIKKQPVELKVTHLYSFNDNGTNKNTYAIGGRLSTKFEGVGVFKAALIGFGGTVPPRLLEGIGGHGFSYQFAYNPTIKAFGKLFGDPDKITYRMPCYEPGKTELAIAIADLHNDQHESIRVFDLILTRYLTKNIFGRVLFSHVNPSTRKRGLSARNSIMLETIYKF